MRRRLHALGIQQRQNGQALGPLGLLGLDGSLLFFYANKGIAFPRIHGTGLVYALVGGAVMSASAR